MQPCRPLLHGWDCPVGSTSLVTDGAATRHSGCSTMADLPASNRYRCVLCRQQLWRAGSPADWFLHYYTTHYAKD